MTMKEQELHGELLPCPFCGMGDAYITDTMPAGAYWCLCGHCGAETQGSQIQSEAIAAWNRRASPSPTHRVWSEEAVALALSWLRGEVGSVDPQKLRAAADSVAALAASSVCPATGFKVKALVWCVNRGFAADTSFGLYEVEPHGAVWHLLHGGSHLSSHPTEDEAKAAAQADFDSRIRSSVCPPVSGEWQDIATAPKDGAWFLGYRPDLEVHETIDVWHWDAEADTDGAPGFWVNAADSNIDEYPTHWQPLPTPPVTEAQP